MRRSLGLLGLTVVVLGVTGAFAPLLADDGLPDLTGIVDDAPASAEAPPPLPAEPPPPSLELPPAPTVVETLPESLPPPSPLPSPEAVAEVVPSPSPEVSPEPSPEVVAEAPSPVPSPEAVAEVQEVVAQNPQHPDMKTPLYQKTRPQLGIQLGATGSLFNQSSLMATEIAFEFQPAVVQTIGVLGMGPTLGLVGNKFLAVPNTSFDTSLGSSWVVGGQVRYQAKFFREQWIVPQGGFALHRWTLKYVDGSRDQPLMMGPFFGGWFLLNVLEPKSASSMYVNTGISRSYLTAEYRLLSGTLSGAKQSSGTLYFGVRVEL